MTWICISRLSYETVWYRANIRGVSEGQQGYHRDCRFSCRCSSLLYVPEVRVRSTSWPWDAAICSAGKASEYKSHRLWNHWQTSRRLNLIISLELKCILGSRAALKLQCSFNSCDLWMQTDTWADLTKGVTVTPAAKTQPLRMEV